MSTNEQLPEGTESGEKIQKPKKAKKKRTAASYAVEFFIRLALTALAAWIVLTFVAGVYVEHTNSSYPMLKDGDLCITLKVKDPMRGELIAYKRDDKIRFGRVIAMGGDTVDIKENYVMVNGFGIFEDTLYPTKAEGSKIAYPYTVPEGSYFVLNDYRTDVTDSRTFGAIDKKDYKGKMIFIMRRRGF